MAAQDEPILEYDTSATHRPRRTLRAAARVSCAVVAILLAAMLAISAIERFKLNSAILQAIDFQMPRDKLVHADPSYGMASTEQSKWVAPEWTSLIIASGRRLHIGQGTIYLGELRNSNGQPRLVHVAVINDAPSLRYWAETIVPPRSRLSADRGWTSSDGSLAESVPQTAVRINSAQRSSGDASHFTFTGSIGDRVIAFNGFLLDNDTVVIEHALPAGGLQSVGVPATAPSSASP